jgi:cytoskeletal protein CcmA (bactofilin family)
LCEGTTLNGDLEVRGKLYISGTFQGKISCGDLVYVCEGGVVNGEVLAMDVRVAGYFEGSVECGELCIDPTGRFSGEAATDTFVISSGGQFHGESRKRPADNVTQLVRSSEQSHNRRQVGHND